MRIPTSEYLKASGDEYEDIALLWTGVMSYETEVRRLLGGCGYPKVAAGGDRKEGDAQERYDSDLWDAVNEKESLVRNFIARLERQKASTREAVGKGAPQQSSKQPEADKLAAIAGAPNPSPSPEPGRDPNPNPNPQPQPIPYGAADDGKEARQQGPRMTLAEPKMFTGEMSSGVGTRGDIQYWVDYMESYFQLTHTKDNLKFPYAMAHLEGAALHYAKRILAEGTPPLADPAIWLRLADVAKVEFPAPVREIDHGTWSWLKRKLLAQFQSFRTGSYLRWQLDNLSQARNRWTVQQYWGEFEKIASRIPDMGQQDRLHAFLRGLRPELAAKVNGAYWKVPNVEQAAAIAAEEELLRKRAYEERERQSRAGHLSSLSMNPYHAISEEQEMHMHGEGNIITTETMSGSGEHALNAMSNSTTPRSSAAQPPQGGGMGGFTRGPRFSCHYCGRAGHFVRDCNGRRIDRSRGIFRANRFQPIPEKNTSTQTSTVAGTKGGKESSQQGKEEAHQRE